MKPARRKEACSHTAKSPLRFRPRIEWLENRTLLAAGDLDLAFGVDGRVTRDFDGADDTAISVAFQADGKIIVAGHTARHVNNDSIDADFAVSRYNSDGSLDTSFGNGGTVTTDFGSYQDVAKSVAVQADGKIVVAGYTRNFYTLFDFAVARYESDGSLDMSFSGDGKLTTDFAVSEDTACGMVLQSNGKIVVAGLTYSYQSDPDFLLARYNSDGGLDQSFDGDGILTTDFEGYDDIARCIAIQNDGKIIVAGNMFKPDVLPLFEIARYNIDGSLDVSFNDDGKLTAVFGDAVVTSVAVQPNGAIFAAGTGVLARYNVDGNLDASFSDDGYLTTGFATSPDFPNIVSVQRDGRIIIAATAVANDRDFLVACFNPDGTLDSAFGAEGAVTTGFGESDDDAFSMVLQSDGKIVVAGRMWNGTDHDFAIARYLPDDRPVANNDAASILEDSPATAIDVLVNDADLQNDALTIQSVTQPANGTVVINDDGMGLTYKPNPDFNGINTFTYIISDGNSGTATGTVEVTVTSVNDPPNAVDDDFTIPAGRASILDVIANDTDTDGNTLLVTVLTQASHGLVSITGGGTSVTYTPTKGFTGADTFAYTISDGSGGSATAIVNISVQPAVSFNRANSMGSEAFSPARIIVKLTPAQSSLVTVQYVMFGGTATSGVDFVLLGTGTLTFEPGKTKAKIRLAVFSDKVPEPNETVTLSLRNATDNVLIGPNQLHTHVIIDDDRFASARSAFAADALLSSPWAWRRGKKSI